MSKRSMSPGQAHICTLYKEKLNYQTTLFNKAFAFSPLALTLF